MNNKTLDTGFGNKKIILTRKKVIKPKRAEIVENRRSRSAKLRFVCIEK